MVQWKECKISDIGTVVGGATPSTKVVENYENGTISWITPKDLADFKGRYILRGERNITEQGLKSCSAQLFPPDTVLFFSRAPIGYLAIAEKEMCTNQGFKSVIPNKDTDPLFLFYLLKYNKDAIEHMGSGTTFKEVSGSTMKNIVVKVPVDIDIQKKISRVLGSIDDKIELNQKVNDNLERQAQAIFENWLAECDEKITIGELCENILDYSKCTNNEVVLVNSSDVTNGHFEHHTLSLNSNLKGHFKKRFKKWDILFSEIRPRNHHFAYCQFDPTNYIASTRLMVLRNRSSMISSSLLYRYLMLNDVLEEFILKTESRSGTFPQGCFEDLSRITVSYSPIKRQEEINGAIEDIHSLSWNIEKENQQLSSIRDSLLPRLMSGELDVSEIEL